MDPITSSLMKEFIKSQQISSKSELEQFEHFVNYVVLFDVFPEKFDIESIATGAGEFGIDGIAIIVNDTIIDDEEQLDDLAENTSSLNVRFIFTQSKSSRGFDTGDLSKFFLGTIDFFRKELSFVQNDNVRRLHKIKEKIYAYAPKFTRERPKLSMYYATTGSWQSDQNLASVVAAHTATLNGMHIFSSVDFTPIDATKLQKLYFQTKNAIKVVINFPSNITLPPIVGVRESYIGVLPVSEYLKLITDDDNSVRRRLFFDNIRDFQGDTEVNLSIAGTISSEKRIEFPLRNNGITIVSRKLQRVSNDFHVEDFQIVNGCQTGYILSQTWDKTFGDILIPIKLIVTEDEEVTRNIIIASNSQNDVDRDSFWALDPIHKKIEIFFESKKGDASILYERRPGQYSSAQNIEKVRVFTKDGPLKIFASVFLEEPNQVGRYYKDLLPRIGKDIFNETHQVYAYYTAALLSYRLEWLFRTKRLDTKYKPFRYQLCMAARLIVQQSKKLDSSKKLTKAYCKEIDEICLNADQSSSLFERAIGFVNDAVAELSKTDEYVDVDRRTAEMRDMRDVLRRRISEANLAEEVA